MTDVGHLWIFSSFMCLGLFLTSMPSSKVEQETNLIIDHL